METTQQELMDANPQFFAEIAEQIVACPIKRRATKEELAGLVLMFKHRGFRACFEE